MIKKSDLKNLAWAILFSAIILAVIYFAMNSFPAKLKNQNAEDAQNIKPENVQVKGEQVRKLEYNPNIETTAWLATWAWQEGVKSFSTHQSKFSSISPVWYELNEDGSLKKLRDNVDKTLFSEVMGSNNIKLMPTVANFDHVLFSKILQDETSFNNHIDAIVNEVVSHNYAGIDLDYESIELKDKEKFFSFLQILSTKLHTLDKKLSFTVLAKWNDSYNSYTVLNQTREVQDWTEISKYADEIRIMTYDYTFVTARYPGPIGPIGWIEEVLDYAVTKVEPSKLVLGIHLYAYEWWIESDPKNPAEDILLEYKFNSGDNVYPNIHNARSYIYQTVKKALRENQGETIDYQGEKAFRYSKINNATQKQEKRVLVYIDPEGVKQRQELARKYGLKGVAYWRLGQEDELL